MQILERKLAELSTAYERSCKERRLLRYEQVLAMDAEANHMRTFRSSLAELASERDQLGLFISLFPPDAQELVHAQFNDAVIRSECKLRDLHVWNRDNDWSCTYKVGRSMSLFEIDGGTLRIAGRSFRIDPQRGSSIYECMTSFYNMFC